LRTIKRLEPDLVIFEWWTPVLAPVIGTLARLLSRSGFRCIFECHNVFPHETTFLDLPMVQYALGAAEAFISFSRMNLLPLKELFPEKASFCTALPAPFTVPSQSARAGSTILFFGIVRPYKGLDVLLRALKIVLSRVRCKLIIAGEFYEPVDKYLGLIDRLGLQQYVEIDDRYVPNEEIAALFERADVLALPYRHATQSGVLRGALGSRLPVVASAVGAFCDEVVHNLNGLLVRPGDPDELAAALVRYFKAGLGPQFAHNMSSANATADDAELAGIIESLAAPPALPR
jgi:glycosyltransferase involved in cell wall biosynthesis